MYLYKNFENEYLEDLEKTGTHKRRLAKITMYLEVPSLKTDKDTGITTFKTESEIENEIERIVSKSLSKNDIYTTSPSDIMVSPIESDDPSEFKTPVGYLSPDGKFYLIESEENGLAHLELAHRVYDLYRDYIRDNRIFGPQIEDTLEHAGFIKVHGESVYYFANLPYGGYYDQTNCRTPRVNEIQQQRLLEYFENKHFELERDYGVRVVVGINDHYNIDLHKLKQMDNTQFNTYFIL